MWNVVTHTYNSEAGEFLWVSGQPDVYSKSVLSTPASSEDIL